jgi:hypothetical protein
LPVASRFGTDFTYKEGAERILARFRPERVRGTYDDTTEAELKSGGDWEHYSLAS